MLQSPTTPPSGSSVLSPLTSPLSPSSQLFHAGTKAIIWGMQTRAVQVGKGCICQAGMCKSGRVVQVRQGCAGREGLCRPGRAVQVR